MRHHPFGPGRPDLPVIGQGTWNMERDDKAPVLAALRAGLDLGMTHVDTAELYGNGRVEEAVGEAIAGRRDQVFLVSKVMPQNASTEGTLQACMRSLCRLKTDRLDLYLLHWRGPHALSHTFRAFQTLLRDGRILHFGVSNFDVADLEEAVHILPAEYIACNQVLYHLGERGIEHRVLPFCEARGIAVVGYSPFGSGRFPPRGAWPEVEAIAQERSVSARQVVLAFLTRRPSLFAIPKASRVDHVKDNAAAGDLVLTDDEVARIDRAFPLPAPRRGLATL